MSKNTDFHFLQDSQGNQSSKRLAGFIILGIAMILSVILFGCSLFFSASDSDIALGIIEWLTLCGAGLLGVGVIEKLGK